MVLGQITVVCETSNETSGRDLKKPESRLNCWNLQSKRYLYEPKSGLELLDWLLQKSKSHRHN